MAHILLVEDEQFVSEALASAMMGVGHTVVTASNGVEGLKRFAEQAFDLVVTDIIMPDKEGIEMILDMRKRKPETKIIAISGGGRTGNVEFLDMAASVGAMAMLKKPIPLAKFLSVLTESLNQSPPPHQTDRTRTTVLI
jgi:YesN/AraC family two-component response regulator